MNDIVDLNDEEEGQNVTVIAGKLPPVMEDDSAETRTTVASSLRRESVPSTGSINVRRQDPPASEDGDHLVDSAALRQKLATSKERIRLWNEQDLYLVRELLTDDFSFCWTKMTLTRKDMVGETPSLFASFPDFQFRFAATKAVDEDTIVLCDVIASGTHTGAPFGFGPYDPIEASGKYVENDPEDIYIHFEGTKMRRHDLVSKGEMVGPFGMYSQLPGSFPVT